MSIDLLVFGPHPDDIEIGLGGTVARHTAAGHRVGLCDLTQRRAVEQRHARAAAARKPRRPPRVLGAAVAREPRLARRRHRRDTADASGRPSTSSAATGRAAIAIPYWDDRHPDHVAASHVLRTAAFRSGLRRYETDAEPWRPEWVCYYFINDSAPPSFVVDVSAHYERKREALDCYRSQFAPRGRGAVATRLTAPTFRQLIESRDAQFGALAGVALRRRHRRPRTGRSAPAC